MGYLVGETYTRKGEVNTVKSLPSSCCLIRDELITLIMTYLIVINGRPFVSYSHFNSSYCDMWMQVLSSYLLMKSSLTK